MLYFFNFKAIKMTTGRLMQKHREGGEKADVLLFNHYMNKPTELCLPKVINND